jgi:hypothetical protein
MTNRQFLRQRLRRWMYPVVPCLIGYIWIRYFGNNSHHVDYRRDNLALLTGGIVMAALAYAQYRFARARFRCPRCRTNLWSQYGELESAQLSCPHCALNMDEPYDDHGKRVWL